MAKSAGVYRTEYISKTTGRKRKAATWYAAYWDASQKKRVKLYGFASAAAAQKARVNATTRATPSSATAHTITVQEITDLVKADYEAQGRKAASVKKQVALARVLGEYLGATTQARYIDKARVQGMIIAMRKDEYAPATINRHLAHLRRAFRLAAEAHEGLARPSVKLLDEKSGIRQGFVEPEQIGAMIATMQPVAAAMVRVLHLTGWRCSEVTSRKWSDVEDGSLHLRPGETKNGRGRTFPMQPDLEGILKSVPVVGPYIFGKTSASASHTLRRAWEAARASTKLSHLILHDLRRTAARDLIKAGVDRDTAKRVLGHETDSIFSRYRIIQGDDLKDAAKKLSAYRLGSKLGTNNSDSHDSGSMGVG